MTLYEMGERILDLHRALDTAQFAAEQGWERAERFRVRVSDLEALLAEGSKLYDRDFGGEIGTQTVRWMDRVRVAIGEQDQLLYNVAAQEEAHE